MTTIRHRAVREADGEALTLIERIEQIDDGLGGTMNGMRSMRDTSGHIYNVVKPVSEKRYSHYETKEVVRLLD